MICPCKKGDTVKKGMIKSFPAVYDDGEQTVEAGDEISWEKPSEAD